MANILSGSSREDYDLVELRPGLGEMSNVGDWAIDQHLDGLVREIRTSPPSGVFRYFLGLTGKRPSQARRDVENQRELGYRVSFAEMQRVRLRKLQVKLVTHALRMHQDKKDHEEGWDKDLSDYVQALKDYDYMVQCSRLRHDYFIATSERYVDRYVIQQVINRIVKRDKFLRKTKSTTPVEAYSDESLPIGGLRNEDTRLTEVENLRHRMLMAAIGAFLMLGPMWIMVLHRTLYTGLITTTAYVSAFGLVAAWWLDTPATVVSATATYAAILVVFVGLTVS